MRRTWRSPAHLGHGGVGRRGGPDPLVVMAELSAMAESGNSGADGRASWSSCSVGPSADRATI